MKTEYLKCPECNWVAFRVTRKYAERQVKRFNDYFATLTKQRQDEYYGGKGSSIKSYERCFRCGASHKKAKVALGTEVPMGSTIQPMIDPKQ